MVILLSFLLLRNKSIKLIKYDKEWTIKAMEERYELFCDNNMIDEKIRELFIYEEYAES